MAAVALGEVSQGTAIQDLIQGQTFVFREKKRDGMTRHEQTCDAA